MGQITKNTGTSGGDFEPAPEGTFQGVVCDVIDLGWVEKTYQGKSQGLKPQMSFVYQLGGVDEDEYPVAREDGTPYLIFGQRHVVSLDERAGFFRELGQILGSKKRDAMIEEGFDTEDLVGLNVQLTVVHNVSQKNGKTYTNIDTMSPWLKRYGEGIEVRDYTRRDARPDYVPPEFSAFDEGPPKDEAEEPAPPPPRPARKPAPKTDEAPVMSNAKHNAREHARKLARGEETDPLPRPAGRPPASEAEGEEFDDDDPFADSDDDPELLPEMPRKAKAGAYGTD